MSKTQLSRRDLFRSVALAGIAGVVPVCIGCGPSEHPAATTPDCVLAIVIDPTVPATLDRLKNKKSWEPIFKTAVQHRIPVLMVRAAAGDEQPVKFSGRAAKIAELTAALQAASQPPPGTGSSLYPATQAVQEWLSSPDFARSKKTALLVTDTINDPRKVNEQTRETYRSLFDVDFRALPNLMIQFAGVPANRVSAVLGNIPTASVAISGAEAEALTPAHLGLPEPIEEDI